jgi:Lamin Tail Domain/PEP-CTERM motif
MNFSAFKKVSFATALVAVFAVSAQAQVRITEVAPWSSGSSPILSDWFELTNFGPTAVSITGWTMDDNSNSFAVSTALTGITSIGAHESVIFTETATAAAFKSLWFGATPPAGLQVGNYTGGGVGLSTAGDAVNIFNATGTLIANVTFGASDAVVPLQTFENPLGLNNVAVSALSVAGVNGAFAATNDSLEIGSPGSIAAVPEADTYAMMLAGLGLVGAIARRRKQK